MIEGYIKKIEQANGTTVLTLEIVPPKKIGCPDAQDYGDADLAVAEEQYQKWKEGYNKLIIEAEKLHIGLVTLSQQEEQP